MSNNYFLADLFWRVFFASIPALLLLFTLFLLQGCGQNSRNTELLQYIEEYNQVVVKYDLKVNKHLDVLDFDFIQSACNCSGYFRYYTLTHEREIKIDIDTWMNLTSKNRSDVKRYLVFHEITHAYLNFFWHIEGGKYLMNSEMHDDFLSQEIPFDWLEEQILKTYDIMLQTNSKSRN